jgi:predicted RNA polymerase sigma factor
VSESLEARRAVERAARDSRGRLLAFLAARGGDLGEAEDALADAFAAALERWPIAGVPGKPEAWLLVAARRRLIDAARSRRVSDVARPALQQAAEEAEVTAERDPVFPDERLRLLFVCAHPAIAASARTPLMLQTVLGLDAARIASAFLMKPSAMGARLARAKGKIRNAGIPFTVPESHELAPRLDAVLEAVYAAYGTGWDDVAGADARTRGLAREAVELGRLLVQLLPAEPEALGLLSLMLHCEARRPARRSPEGCYLPLSEQDPALWDHALTSEAESLLRAAAALNRHDRFQLEAAIQSAHAQRKWTGTTDWEAIALLYEGLVRRAPTVGARVAQAAAVAEARGAAAGERLLAAIPPEEVASYQPYWALRAHLCVRLERRGEAADAFQRAIGLCEDPAVRAFLAEKSGVTKPWSG